MSASDYPEHLNPFKEDEKKKSGLHLGSSFKDFKKTIRQSFRIKKKDRRDGVEIRKRTEPFYPRETQTWLPPIVLNSEPITTPALPRSRFRERLAKSYNPDQNGTLHHSMNGSVSDSSPNPFDDGDKNGDVNRIRAPRRKKRAPPPPKSSSSQTINEERPLGDKNDSKWSLTSLETDISSTGNTSEVGCSYDLDISTEFQTFAKEMEKLNEDGENIEDERDTSEETKGSNNRLDMQRIPDVVVTCVHDTENNSSEITNEQENEHDNDAVEEDKREDKASEIKHEEDSQIITHGEIKESVLTDEKETDNNDNPECDYSLNDVKEESICEKPDNISCSSNESLVVVDITSNLKNVEKVDNIVVENKAEEENDENKEPEDDQNIYIENDATTKSEIEINYNERKYIDINGSCDKINKPSGIYSERISLYINGSRETLDEHNNNNESMDDKNNAINGKIPERAETPTPKQRKNKLTKDELLLGHNN